MTRLCLAVLMLVVGRSVLAHDGHQHQLVVNQPVHQPIVNQVVLPRTTVSPDTTTHNIIRQYTITGSLAPVATAPPPTVPVTIRHVHAPASTAVITENAPGCGGENPATRKWCRDRGRVVTDPTACARLNCCYDSANSYCYRRRGVVKATFPARSFYRTGDLMPFGGEPGYRGSLVRKSCPSREGRPCGLGAVTQSACLRWRCCWNPLTSRCTQSVYNIIHLRKTCAPGFTNPPRCDDIDECTSSPCLNNGKCSNKINSFTCDCPPGITGDRCENVCITPPGIANGAVTGTPKPFYNLGEMVTYACSGGYTFGSGVAQSSCTISGQWSQPNGPVCVRVCSNPPITGNLNPDPSLAQNHIGDVVHYTCASGLQLVGDNVNFCLQNGQWSNQSPPTCYDCAPPPQVTTGLGFVVNPQPGYATGAQIQYACTKGYTLRGDDRSTCQGNNVWSAVAPVCDASVCGPPPAVQNANVVYPSGAAPSSTLPQFVAVNAVVTYVCTTAFYTMFGSAQVTCLPGATYSSPVGPTCKHVYNLEVVSAGFFAGDLATIRSGGQDLMTTSIGYNVVHINMQTNDVQHQTFNTNGVSTALAAMVGYLMLIPEGNLIIIAVNNDAYNLATFDPIATQTFTALGAGRSPSCPIDIAYRDSWAIITRKVSNLALLPSWFRCGHSTTSNRVTLTVSISDY